MRYERKRWWEEKREMQRGESGEGPASAPPRRCPVGSAAEVAIGRVGGVWLAVRGTVITEPITASPSRTPPTSVPPIAPYLPFHLPQRECIPSSHPSPIRGRKSRRLSRGQLGEGRGRSSWACRIRGKYTLHANRWANWGEEYGRRRKRRTNVTRPR